MPHDTAVIALGVIRSPAVTRRWIGHVDDRETRLDCKEAVSKEFTPKVLFCGRMGSRQSVSFTETGCESAHPRSVSPWRGLPRQGSLMIHNNQSPAGYQAFFIVLSKLGLAWIHFRRFVGRINQVALLLPHMVRVLSGFGDSSFP